jgi:hypothetical protein
MTGIKPVHFIDQYRSQVGPPSEHHGMYDVCIRQESMFNPRKRETVYTKLHLFHTQTSVCVCVCVCVHVNKHSKTENSTNLNDILYS